MNETESHMQFALCLDNASYEASLELGKLYRVVIDDQAEARGYVRIIDESGEDYAYDIERFYLLTLPESVEQTLLLAIS
ncbi:MAG: hypothetical protein K1X50_14510 [Candidatus Promineofilum sp.]|nr:hypothetical protein [Promineifilum sp.]MCW5863937.1 hypothetical protein [Anaerolineae bacterium]